MEQSTASPAEPESTAPDSPSAGRDLLLRVASLPVPLLLAASLMALVALSLPALLDESCTFDEGTHLIGGLAALSKGDYRLAPDNPPLARMLAALPLLALDLRWPEDDETWETASAWSFAFKLLYQSGNDPDRLLFWGRWAALFWMFVLAASVHHLGRKHFGPRGGLIGLVLATFSPTLLGHAHLCTVDLASAALIFLAVSALADLLRSPDAFRGARFGILFGCALAAKFNALVVPAIAAIAIVVVLMKSRTSRPAEAPRPPLRPRIAAAALALLLPLLVIWAVYGFRFKASPDPGFAFDWASVDAPGSVLDSLADLARDARLLPEGYVYGFKLMQKNTAAGHPTYALGLHSQTGWWWYFPLVLLVKTPVVTLLLVVLGCGSLAKAREKKTALALLAAATVLVYLGLAMSKNMNLGLRHILPVYPFLIFLASGSDLQSLWSSSASKAGRILAALLALAVVEGAIETPHHLAYFNLPSRLAFDRSKLLADSNLDWGQDLARLKRYVDREGIRDLKLSYFGAASPRHLGLRHQVLPGFNLYSAHEPEWSPALSLEPGDDVAISISNFVGLIRNRSIDFPELRDLKPVALVGRTILVFKVP